MFQTGWRAGLAAFGIAWALAAAGTVRGNDPDSGAYFGAEMTQAEELGVGTGGTPAERAQFVALAAQFAARRKEFAAGTTTTDLLLESERFLSQADCDCCATPRQRLAARQLSLTRLQKIHVVCAKKLTAGKAGVSDLAQVEGGRRLAEAQVKLEEGK